MESSKDTFTPPLPHVIVDVLKSAYLCYLATAEANVPHLSLMNFTVVEEPGLGTALIMSTRCDTKKFQLLSKDPRVAVLVHDFAPGRDGTASVTMNGTLQLANGEQKARLRQAHLDNNPTMWQFIAPEDIAILLFVIESARICNLQDQVTMWSHWSSTASRGPTKFQVPQSLNLSGTRLGNSQERSAQYGSSQERSAQ